ncbi:hypothetical protein [Dactylosporangium darangshiense]|uniref:Uncharacterized protein n=1 Tax=Dactylosporangium darangshiense TaxID=579108 RepID=A0ABP8DSY7_9ACTN
MKPLPRQFRPQHRRSGLAVKTGAVSAAVVSAALLATGSTGSTGSPVDHTPVAAVAPAFAYDALMLLPTTGTAAISPAEGVTPAAPAVPVAPPPPQPPRPVAGLNQTQMNNAAAIVRQGRAQGLPPKALVVAVATAMQESDLYNVASPAVPSSLKLPHDGVSQDHDSVGLFQQRASQGWGTVAELMNPAHSAMLFYNALVRVKGWQGMSVTGAAQAVQRSAYPSAYQKHADRAAQVVAAIA